MDEQLKEYLKQKYADQLENINTAQAFANLGDVIAGQKVGSQAPYFERQQKLAESKTLGEIDRQEEMDLRRQMAQENLDLRKMQIEQAAQATEANRSLQKMAIESKKEAINQGKQLPIAPLESLGEAESSIAALDSAMKSFEANKDIAGPQQSYLTQIEKWGEFGETGQRAKAFDAELKLNAQMIGKYLEGGKMTDADIERYKTMLPNLGDSFEVAQRKTQLLKNLIAQKQASQLKALKSGGYNINELQSPQVGPNPNIPKQKTEVKRQYSPSRDQTKIIYSDGSQEVFSGKQPK